MLFVVKGRISVAVTKSAVEEILFRKPAVIKPRLFAHHELYEGRRHSNISTAGAKTNHPVLFLIAGIFLPGCGWCWMFVPAHEAMAWQSRKYVDVAIRLHADP
jgi:hypothetical protein